MRLDLDGSISLVMMSQFQIIEKLGVYRDELTVILSPSLKVLLYGSLFVL